MTAEEKKDAYHFLEIAEGWTDGYRTHRPAPVFTDDPDLSSMTIDSIAESIHTCTNCDLCKTRTNTVPGEGSDHPTVMIIGEGPGADEDARGKPFIGKAGQLLDKMLASIELSRSANCFITNIVKCRPPQNRDPLPDEAVACRHFLIEQIGIIKPVAILAIGRIAIQNLLGTETGIGKLRGHFFDWNGIPLMATYHPSALLRNESLKRPTWEDLKLFRSRLLELVPDYADSFRNGTT